MRISWQKKKNYVSYVSTYMSRSKYNAQVPSCTHSTPPRGGGGALKRRLGVGALPKSLKPDPV